TCKATVEYGRPYNCNVNVPDMGEPGPLPTPAIDRLTARERQALRMVAEHRQSKEIARQLGISAETVDKHIANARRKLGASSRREAARLLLAGERGRHLPVEPPYGSSGRSEERRVGKECRPLRAP